MIGAQGPVGPGPDSKTNLGLAGTVLMVSPAKKKKRESTPRENKNAKTKTNKQNAKTTPRNKKRERKPAMSARALTDLSAWLGLPEDAKAEDVNAA